MRTQLCFDIYFIFMETVSVIKKLEDIFILTVNSSSFLFMVTKRLALIQNQ